MSLTFEIIQQKGRSRAGRMIIPGRPAVETPIFMPVGTQAVVKTLDDNDLENLGVKLLLCNSYHLYLRPGADLIAKAGGLHRFMGWEGSLITDSGGFQIFSLADLRRINSAGVEFISHLDGSKHFFTPESNLQLQHQLGADIFMALDVCVAYPAQPTEVEQAVQLTSTWARRCLEEHEKLGGEKTLFGIIQGGVISAAREFSARDLMTLNFPGYGIGGLSVGETYPLMNQILTLLDNILPENKPRYLMGVGTPHDLWDAVARGVDMFDCVMPTRIARNGTLYTSQGRLIIRNATYADDFSPPDPECYCPLCSRYSRAYLRHLFNTHEITALRLSTLHNLTFMLNLTRFIRESILAGNFAEAWKDFQARYGSRAEIADSFS